jgi:hypothetical protein
MTPEQTPLENGAQVRQNLAALQELRQIKET